MTNLHLLLFPLLAVVAAAQTASVAPKNPALTQELSAPSQSSSTQHLELFPTPEVPPEEPPKNPVSTEGPAMPGQSSSDSHVDLFPIIEVPPDEVPTTTVSTDLSATPRDQSSSDSHVDPFPSIEVPPDEVPTTTVSTDLSATPPDQSSSASRVDLFPIIEVPPDEVPASTASTPDLGTTSLSELPSAPHVELFPVIEVPPDEGESSSAFRGELFPMPEVPADAPLTPAEIELQAQIQNAISKDPTLTSDNVNVSLFPGGIELSGTVATVHARLAASRLAKSYAANRKVVDKITIAARRETPAEPAPTKAEAPGTAHQNP